MEGYTLMHEHVTIDLSGVKQDMDCRLDCYDATVEEFQKLYQLGVRNILEVTNIGMGRNIDYIKRVSQASGIQVFVSTGFYKEPFLPEFVYEQNVEQLTRLLVKEVTVGIEDSGVCASVIGEFGTSKDQMTPMEEKVFAACAAAAVETGVPVTTHTTLGTCGLLQANYLIEHGVSPDKIIIGHMDLSQSLDVILQVLDTGVTIGFDTVGKLNYCPDTFRVQALEEIRKRGFLSQVILSMDITRKSHLAPNGGIGYGYIMETFLPMLKNQGFGERELDQLLVLNPQRILSN